MVVDVGSKRKAEESSDVLQGACGRGERERVRKRTNNCASTKSVELGNRNAAGTHLHSVEKSFGRALWVVELSLPHLYGLFGFEGEEDGRVESVRIAFDSVRQVKSVI